MVFVVGFFPLAYTVKVLPSLHVLVLHSFGAK